MVVGSIFLWCVVAADDGEDFDLMPVSHLRLNLTFVEVIIHLKLYMSVLNAKISIRSASRLKMPVKK